MHTLRSGLANCVPDTVRQAEPGSLRLRRMPNAAWPAGEKLKDLVLRAKLLPVVLLRLKVPEGLEPHLLERPVQLELVHVRRCAAKLR